MNKAGELPALTYITVCSSNPLLIPFHAGVANRSLQNQQVIKKYSDFTNSLITIVLGYFALLGTFTLEFV